VLRLACPVCARLQFLHDAKQMGMRTAAQEPGMMYMDVDLDSHMRRDWVMSERVEQVGAASVLLAPAGVCMYMSGQVGAADMLLAPGMLCWS